MGAQVRSVRPGRLLKDKPSQPGARQPDRESRIGNNAGTKKIHPSKDFITLYKNNKVTLLKSMSAITYEGFISVYFGFFGVGLLVAPIAFFGKDSFLYMPYFNEDVDNTAIFFMRMLGGALLTMVGMNVTKQINSSDYSVQMFVLSVALGIIIGYYTFILNIPEWTPWVWQMQCVLNVAVIIYGYISNRKFSVFESVC